MKKLIIVLIYYYLTSFNIKKLEVNRILDSTNNPTKVTIEQDNLSDISKAKFFQKPDLNDNIIFIVKNKKCFKINLNNLSIAIICIFFSSFLAAIFIRFFNMK